MADYTGLLGGLGAALKGFAEGRKDAQDLALRKRQQQLAMVQSGMVDTGNGFELSPEKKKEAALKLATEQAGLLKSGYMAQYNPESGTYELNKDPEFRDIEKEAKGLEIKKNRLQISELEQKLSEDPSVAAYKKAPEGEKTKVSMIGEALQNLTDYENMFRSGQRQGFITPQTPFLGKIKSSTPIDDARLGMEEALGRLQSGGAISGSEEQRFRAFIPTGADSDKEAVHKIIKFRRAMETKLRAYGVNEKTLEALKFNTKSMGFGNEYSSLPDRGMLKSVDAKQKELPDPDNFTIQDFRKLKAAGKL